MHTGEARQGHGLGIFLTGQFFSMAGTWAVMLALTWAIWKASASPLWLGAVGFSVQFPALVLASLGGLMADRCDRRRMLLWCSFAAASILLALAFLLLRENLSPWILLCAGAGMGSVLALATPAQQAFIVDLSGRARTLRAMSASTALYHASRFLGPALAGLIVARFGEAACVFMGAAMALVLSLSLLLVRSGSEAGVKRAGAAMWKELAQGVHALSAIPEAKLAIIAVMVLSGVGMQFATLMPMFADLRFQGGASALGWLMAATALGSFIAALWLAKRSQRDLFRLALRSALAFSAVIMVFSQLSGLIAAAAALAGAGFFFTAAFSSLSTLVQLRSPEHVRGRLMGLFMTAFMGAAPFAHIAAGLLAERLGAVWATLSSSALCFAACFAILLRARQPKPVAQASEELSAET